MVWHLMLYEWKRTLKHPTLFLFVFLFPIILIAVTGFIVYSVVKEEVDSVDILVLDEDQTFETNTLIETFKSDETLSGQVQFMTGTKSLDTYLSDPQYAAVVQVPQGFTEDLRRGHNREINVYLNEAIPIGSNLAYLLLESGQSYISAAQSGVNTVNQFYIKTMTDSSERTRWVQQMTIHFTLLTLGRNDLFMMDETLENEMLSWRSQLYISTLTVLFLCSYLLFIILFQQKNERLIRERFSLISVSPNKRLNALFLHHFTFSVIYFLLMSYSLAQLLDVTFHMYVLVQWFVIALLFIVTYFINFALFKLKALAVSTFFFVISFILIFSGLIIPPAYISEWLTFDLIHDGFKKIWISDEVPYVLWSIMIAITIGLMLIIGKFIERGKSL